MTQISLKIVQAHRAVSSTRIKTTGNHLSLCVHHWRSDLARSRFCVSVRFVLKFSFSAPPNILNPNVPTNSDRPDQECAVLMDDAEDLLRAFAAKAICPQFPFENYLFDVNITFHLS
jgi:hypothetical protein